MAWEASPAGQGIQQKKQDYLVNPLGEVVGRWGFGAKTDDQLQAVHPASNTMAGLGVDAVLSAVGVQAVRTGAKGVVEGSKGIGGKIDGADGKLGPVQELEVGRYSDLRARDVVGDNLEHDHIPSLAALRADQERLLGRALNVDEVKRLRDQATAVTVHRDVHRESPTYAGRNSAAQIERDAANLCAAACRDIDALRLNLIKRGYSSEAIETAVSKIMKHNEALGIK